MQARCPHCSNVFNTEQGGQQYCPSCGQQINVPDPGGAAAPPGAPAGAPESGSNQQPTAWERRGELGLFKGFVETWKSVITEPEVFWNRLLPKAKLSDPLLFAWLCQVVFVILQLPSQLVMTGINQRNTEEMMKLLKNLPPQWQEIAAQLSSSSGSIGYSVGQLIAYPLSFFIGAAITHLFCLIFGVAKNGFEATARVNGYATAPFLLGWVPCVGPVAAGIFYVVLLIWGLARVHQSTTGRAAAAILVPIGLFLCCCCIGAAVFGVAMAGAAASQVQ